MEKNTILEELYCDREISLLLKNVGFNGKCHVYYRTDDNSVGAEKYPIDYTTEFIDDCIVLIPTLQMAQDFLRKKGIQIIPFYEELPKGSYWCRVERHPYTEYVQEVNVFKTYEASLSDAIKYILLNKDEFQLQKIK